MKCFKNACIESIRVHSTRLLLVIYFGQVSVSLGEYALKIGDGFADFWVSLRLRRGQDDQVLEELLAHLRSHRRAAAQSWV